MKTELFSMGVIDNTPITGCRIDNGQIAVVLSSCGAAIHGIYDRGENLTLTLSSPCRNPLYAGATLAPNAGRLSDGRLLLPDGPVPLSKNDGQHQLHGGFHNLSFCNWAVADIKKAPDAGSVTFFCCLPDGIDGYPGNRSFTVCYTFTNDHALMVRYHAESDRPTYINMANHAYFNLSGDFTSSVLSHRLQIAAARYTTLRPDHIPSGIAPCAGSPFDFSHPCTLEEQAQKYPCHPQLEIGHGYNHGFLLDSPCDFSVMQKDAGPCLTLEEPVSGRMLRVYTDAPCIVVYSGGFIGDALVLEDGVRTADSCAVAIECQDLPDTPSLAPERMRLTTPVQPFDRTIVYQFCCF